MILAIDIGNSNIVAGCVDHDEILFVERIATVRTKTELEYAVDIKTLFDLHDIDRKQVEGCMIASVVPQITWILKEAAEKLGIEDVKVLGPGMKTGLNIMVDEPGSVGADLVAGAVGGVANYPVPLIIIDMGTATTLCAIDGNKNYIGGMIIPGVGTSLDALTGRAALLGSVSLDAPKRVIGKNTAECMQSGILYSNASAMDGCIQRMEEELGEKATVVATGGLAGKVIPLCRREIILDDELLLKGLNIIYHKNKD